MVFVVKCWIYSEYLFVAFIYIYIGNAGEEKKLEWNETITFDVEYDPDAEDQPYKLVLQIFDKHKISEDNQVGEST